MAAPAGHPARPAHRLRTHRCQSRRENRPARHPAHRPDTEHSPKRADPRRGQNYFGAEFETTFTEEGLILVRPARKGEPQRAGVGGPVVAASAAVVISTMSIGHRAHHRARGGRLRGCHSFGPSGAANIPPGAAQGWGHTTNGVFGRCLSRRRMGKSCLGWVTLTGALPRSFSTRAKPPDLSRPAPECRSTQPGGRYR